VPGVPASRPCGWARHAGFLNKAMSDFDLALDLGFLTKNRQVSAVRCAFQNPPIHSGSGLGVRRWTQ